MYMSTRGGTTLHLIREWSDTFVAQCNTKFVLDPETKTDEGKVCRNCSSKKRW